MFEEGKKYYDRTGKEYIFFRRVNNLLVFKVDENQLECRFETGTYRMNEETEMDIINV